MDFLEIAKATNDVWKAGYDEGYSKGWEDGKNEALKAMDKAFAKEVA